jgi:hypothetical protein
MTVRNGDPIIFEKVLGLVFVDVHAGATPDCVWMKMMVKKGKASVCRPFKGVRLSTTCPVRQGFAARLSMEWRPGKVLTDRTPCVLNCIV